MKILQVHKYYYPRDGASNYVLSLSKGLEQKGTKIIPFAMKSKEMLDSKYQEFFVSEFDIANPKKLSFFQKIRFALRMIYSFEAKKKLKSLLKIENINIAHLHNIYHHISPSILPLLHKEKIPVVMTIHDLNLLSPNYVMFHHGAVHEEDSKGFYLSCIKNKCVKDSYSSSIFAVLNSIMAQKIFRWYKRYVDYFIAPSQFVKDLFVKYGWDENKIIHIPHPFNLDTDNIKIEDGEYILYSGRLVEEKGLYNLLRVAKNTPEINYVIAGTGPEENKLKELVRKEKIDNVDFVGFLQGKELENIYIKAKLVIVPSICFDISPLSVLEGLSYGKLVLGSRIGGITEMLESDLLFEAGNEAEMIEKIKKWFFAKQEERTNIIKNIISRESKNRNFDKHIENVMQVYKKVLL